MEPVFLSLDEILEIHQQQIERYGGSAGLRDAAGLESAAATPQATFGGEYLHTSIPAMAAAYPVSGPIDPVGAGDSTSAGIACALAAGSTLEEAAAFGNLVASITIQQIGTTGTATPEQVRRRWCEVRV